MLNSNNYLEAIYYERFDALPNLIKSIWYKTIGLVKIRSNNAENFTQSQYEIAKEKFPNINFEKIARAIMLNNKQETVDIVNQSMYSEGFISDKIERFKAPAKVDKKELFDKVKKGFIPSATFYPTLKLFEQFFKVIEGQIDPSQIQLHLSSTEMLTILSATFIYLFSKTIKDANELLESKMAKMKAEESNREKTYNRINKVLDNKLWTPEQMDEWINQKLWSPEQLDALISEKVAKAMHEDFFDYMEIGYNNNNNRRMETFWNLAKGVKDRSASYLLEVISNILIKCNFSQVSEYFNAISTERPVNENNEYNESIIKSFKELSSEIFPSLGFFAAFKVWDILDKLLWNKDFRELTSIEKSVLALYTAVFMGIVGWKIGANRIKDYMELKRKQKEDEECENSISCMRNDDE